MIDVGGGIGAQTIMVAEAHPHIRVVVEDRAQVVAAARSVRPSTFCHPSCALIYASSDPRTACEWQSMVNNQKLMMNNFKSAMEKLAIVGHNARDLIDCSDLIPAAMPPVAKPATFPAGTTSQDVQQACPSPFPVLSTDGT